MDRIKSISQATRFVEPVSHKNVETLYQKRTNMETSIFIIFRSSFFRSFQRKNISEKKQAKTIL